jgi:capsular polysaccharide biosynthesis protein
VTRAISPDAEGGRWTSDVDDHGWVATMSPSVPHWGIDADSWAVPWAVKGEMKALEKIPVTLDESPGVLQSVWRYKWLVATMVLLGMLAGYGWSIRQPTLYAAVSRVLLTQRDFGMLEERPGQPNNSDPDRFVRNQAEIITSTPVLRRATELLKRDEAPLTLRGRVDVELTKGSDLIAIKALDSTPRGAKALADAVGVAYQQVVAEQFQDAAKRATQELKAVRSELEGRLTALEPALAANPDDPGLKSQHEAILRGLREVDRDVEDLNVKASLAGTGDVDLEPAVVPDGPTQPRPRRTAAAGALFGLVASGALAWWLNGRRAARAGTAEDHESDVGDGAGRRLPSWLGRVSTTARERGQPAAEAHPADQRLRQDDERWADSHRLEEPVVVAPEASPHGNGATPRQAQESAGVPEPPLDDPSQRRPSVRQAMGRVLGGPLRPEATSSAAATQSPLDAAGFEQLPARLEKLANVLADQPLSIYTDNMPQAMAEQTAERLAADVVALLLDNGRGILDVAGGVGLDEDEWAATISHDDQVVHSLLRNGVARYRRAQLGFKDSSLPVGSAEAFMVAPLLYEGLGFGVLLAGRKRVNGKPASPFNDNDTQEIVAFTHEATPLLRTAVLLRYLKARLQAQD